MSSVSTATARADTRHPQYQELKSRVHQGLLNRLNLERLTRVSRDEAEPEIRGVITGMLDAESAQFPLSLFERQSLISDVLNELFGLGPIEELLADPEISDILVNRFDQVYVERNGLLEPADVVFKDDAHLLRIIERIVSSVGRRIDESSPMVDARLADGSRVNAIIPPLALDGPVLSIRRFRTDRLGAQDLVERDSLSQPMLEFIRAADFHHVCIERFRTAECGSLPGMKRVGLTIAGRLALACAHAYDRVVSVFASLYPVLSRLENRKCQVGRINFKNIVAIQSLHTNTEQT